MKNYQKIAQGAVHQPFAAQQKYTELASLLELIDQKQIKTIVEIGVYKGGTIKAWVDTIGPQVRIIGIDLPGGKFGGGFDDMQRKLIEGLGNIVLLDSDSQSRDTLDRVIDLVGEGKKIDFLFIDGDHTFKGVERDYELYAPLVRMGGFIAFHDIVEHKNPDVEVHKLWDDLKYGSVMYHEFIDEDFPSDHNPWGGIGVIEV